MNRVFGLILFLISFLLMAWSILTAIGLIMNLSSPQNAYGIGLIVGKVFAIILLGLLGYRALKAGRNKFTLD